MSYIDPDYPVASNMYGGFLQHTYQQPQSFDTSLYGGMSSFNGYGMPNMSIPNDSRRNLGYPIQGNGYNPFATAPMSQTAPTAPAESQVQPFSTYPPTTPTQGTSYGFNTLVDSRRNTPTNTVGGNPWANVNNNPPTPSTMPAMNPNPWGNMYSDPMMGFNGYRVEPSVAALYERGNFGFDKKIGCWDNQFTDPRYYPTPQIDWAVTTQPQQAQINYPSYPTPQYTRPQMTWSELADKNFK